MTTLLRHVSTGDLYPFNENLARRDDMVAYTPPPEGAVEKPIIRAIEEEVVFKPAPKSKVDKGLPNLDDL